MILAKDIVRIFGLQPLSEEGGFYKETYRSSEAVPLDALPDRYRTPKALSTAIYYLLTPDTFSSLHKLPTDEIYHFYLGDPVIMLNLHPNGTSETIVLGPEVDKGQQVQVIVPKHTWQGSFLKEKGNFALMGTTMAPGFDFSDYEAGNRAHLIEKYPDKKELIIKLTP
jgi:hypothetical protein